MKIFGIGLNKTGTLKACLVTLGFTHYKCDRSLLKDYRLKNDFSRIFQIVNKYDSFSDWPWALIYKELDINFSGSKFILTVRKDAQRWLESLRRHSLFSPPFKHCRKLAYGYNYPFWHNKEHIKIYEEHNQKVMEYFKDRPDDLLILSWEDGDGWEKLCNFLNKEKPNVTLPHCHRRKKIRLSRKSIINALLSMLSIFELSEFKNY